MTIMKHVAGLPLQLFCIIWLSNVKESPPPHNLDTFIHRRKNLMIQERLDHLKGLTKRGVKQNGTNDC
jgi:hypothetical protein